MSDILVGIGCDRAQDLAAEVLRYSIEFHSTSGSQIVKLHDAPQWKDMAASLKGKQRTPFSFQRFLLARQLLDSTAEVGIYIDSDMLIFRPIEQLVSEFQTNGNNVATVALLKEWRRRHQSSVMIMNRMGAEQLWVSYIKFLEDSISYDELIYLKTIAPGGEISYYWNCLEYLDENTALIHYTDMDTQPWLRDGNPNAGIWYTYLWRYAQTQEGRALLISEIDKRHVRPSLMEVVELGPSLSAFSADAKLKDLLFVPPHRFKRLSSQFLRRIFAPLLRAIITLQFWVTKGQPNVR